MGSASEIQAYTNDPHSELTETREHSNDQSEEIKKELQADYEDNIYCMPFHRATTYSDWSAVEIYLKDDPLALTAEVSDVDAILHVADSTCCREHDSFSNEPSQEIKNGKSDSADDDGLTKNETELQPDSDEGAKGISKKGVIYYMPLHKAAIYGDWSAVERFLKDDPEALTAQVSAYYRILHVAVSTGHSISFLQKLVDLMPRESLAMKNPEEDTPLHYAAIAGNTKAAKILVEKDLTLTQQTNDDHHSPLHCAAQYGHEETVRYLLTVTRDENPSPFVGKRGVKLLNYLITADFYDIALDILKRYPMLALEVDSAGNTALLTLAEKPKAFPSGNNATIYEHFLTSFACTFNIRQNVTRHGDVENPGGSSEEFPKEAKLYKFLQSIHEKTLMHQQALQLLRILVSEAVKHSDNHAFELLGPSVRVAAQLGIHEFVTEVIKTFPLSIGLFDDKRRNLYHLAIIHRQEKVFNLLFQLSSYKHFLTQLSDTYDNNMLHMAAKLAPSSRISGAALQMQQELQWFKEVEKIVPPAYKEMRNGEGKTPRMVFKEEHEKLIEQGEKWMKDTASSCALVAALVVTVVFAANFTAPGGNDQHTGFPIFLNNASFIIFTIANALALFSSSASLLMFLGILTSRYSEEDFLRALPMRLSIGLITLFFSIAAMLAAFSASLYIVLSHKVSWIGVPIGLGACVPVTLFSLLQFPLLVEIVSSTFGPSIFRKQGDENIM